MQNKSLYCCLLLVALPCFAWAQFEQSPIGRVKPSAKKTIAKTQDGDVLPKSLPFWDDFSYALDHPVDSLWIMNSTVLVNNGQAIHPPTLNVATFDGLTETGRPYSASPTDILDYGYRDTLETQPIRMGDVTLADQNSVFLSFYYQAGGNGEFPDDSDFLRLEFKSNEPGSPWKTIATYRSTDLDHDVFNFEMIRINEAKYFHNEFRFRFISFGRKSGRYDAWHIDYVYLNKGRSALVTTVPDRAISTPIGAVFGNYYSVPMKHFFHEPELNLTSFYVKSLHSDPTTMYYSTLLKAKKNYTSSSVTSAGTLDLVTSLFDDNGTVAGGALREVFIDSLPETTNPVFFDPNAKGIEWEMKLWLQSEDVPGGGIDYFHNDTTYVKYFLDSVYAYDDGVAEYAAGLTTPGNHAAYRFEVHAGNDSILNAVYIHFPVTPGAVPSSMDFFILDHDGDGNPGDVLYEETIDVEVSPNNEFNLTELALGVIVRDTFFLAYREPSTGRVRIGLDKSNDTGDRMFYKLSDGAAWQLNDRVTGSLMMRPRFGPGQVVSGIPENEKRIAVYPNPNRGRFYMKGYVEQIQLLSLTGQPIDFSTENISGETLLSVSNPKTGLYILRYKSGSKVYTDKIFIQE